MKALLLLALFTGNTSVWAAPCCSGNSATPALISGDERAQLGAAVSEGHVIGDAPDSGPAVFRSNEESEVTRTYRLDGAFLVNDRIQIGTSLPLVQRSLREGATESSASNLGDVKVSSAYEVLPEWSYSSWKPRGYLYTQITAPTGHSLYEETNGNLSRTTGRGFWALAVGGVFLKSKKTFDLVLIPEVHRSFSRTFAGQNGDQVEVTEGFGGSLLFGGGLHFGDFRVGARFQPVVSQGKSIAFLSSEARSQSGPQASIDAGIDLTYNLNEDHSLTFSYTDQTLFGPAQNSTLSRVGAVQLLKRWQR
jgi:hypothetical protein